MTEPAMDKAELHEARAFTKRLYGSALAEKSSDSFCAAVYRRRLGPATGGLEVAGLEALSTRSLRAQPLPTIVEFDPPTALEPLSGAKQTAEKDRRAAAAQREQALDRTAAIHQLRTANYQAMASVYDEIERLSTTSVGLSPEFVGWPQIQSLITQVCWLNPWCAPGAGPEALADVTSDSSITAVDIPRRLEAEANSINHRAIGLPDFVKRTELTGKGITVAVIDSEVALSHPALRGRVVHRRNYTSEPWGNPDSHGTAVAGLIAADDQDAGGVAPMRRSTTTRCWRPTASCMPTVSLAPWPSSTRWRTGPPWPIARGEPVRSHGPRAERRSPSILPGHWAWWWSRAPGTRGRARAP